MLISNKEVKRHKNYVSKDVNKPVLQGVYVNKRGKYITTASTDGYKLLEIMHKNNPDIEDYPLEPNVIHGSAIGKIFSFKEMVNHFKIKVKSLPILNNIFFSDRGTYSTDLQVKNSVSNVIEGTFPNYRQVFPKGVKPIAKVCVNATLLKQMAESMEHVNDINTVEIVIYGELKPIKLRQANKDGLYRALLMPVRRKG